MTDPYKRDRRLGGWFIADQQQRAYPGILQHTRFSAPPKGPDAPRAKAGTN